MVQDNLWLGVAGVQGWGGAEPGDMARWNITSGNWEDPIGSYGSVQRVNAQFLGDCFPIASGNCEFWVSYGDSILRRYNATDMTYWIHGTTYQALSEALSHLGRPIYSVLRTEF